MKIRGGIILSFYIFFGLSMYTCNNSKKPANNGSMVYETESTVINDSIYIVFESNFKNDSVRFYNDEKVIFFETITTDRRLGRAYSEKINFGSYRDLQFQLNNLPKIKVDSIRYFPYLYISKDLENGGLTFKFSKDKHLYK